MKINIEATPREIAELLQAITSSKEQRIPTIQPNLTIDANKVFCGSVDPQKMESEI